MRPADSDDPLQTTKRVPDSSPTDPAAGSPPHPPTDPTDGTIVATKAPDVGATSDGRGSRAPLVPGYEILGVLGRGGMGVVYKAHHLALKRIVALKMMLVGGHAGEHELARFRVEAEAVARLVHPNIVQIHEVGEADGHPYCALEFVDGGSLAEKLGGRALTPKEAAKLIEVLARAVQFAHSRNVVHRDLKPANVLLTGDGTPKVTDFGLARRLDTDSGETQAGAVMGTPSYMAPEQASGHSHAAGPAADIYALGAILYECLTGRPPFKGDSVIATLDLVRTMEPSPLRQWQAKVPVDLETVVLKCLRKEPENRYASAAELADELGRFLRGEPVQARPVGRAERVWRWCRRNPGLAATATAAVFALLAGTVVSAHFAVRAGENAQRSGENAVRADENARLADDKAKQAEVNATAAEESARKATRLAAYAGAQRDMTLESFNALLTEVQERLRDTPEMRQVRDRLVETAARGLDKLAEANDGDIGADRGLAQARLRLAHSFETLGNRPAARKQYETAIQLLDVVARENPSDRDARLGAASARSDLSVLVAVDDRPKARALATAAAESLDALLAANTEDAAARQARAIVSQRLGQYLLTDGDRAGAEREFERSLKLREELATAAPDDAARQLALAEAIPFHASRMNTIGGAKSPGFQGVGLSLTGLTFPEVQPPRMPPHSKLLQDQHL